jgi:DNA-binding NtrC family response regulator
MAAHHDPWRVWADVLPIGGVGMRLVAAPHNGDLSRDRRCDDALASIGYQTVRPTMAYDAGQRRHTLHRHVALLVEGPLTDAGRMWLRDLADVSPRAHLIVRPADDVTAARERVMAWSSWPIPEAVCDRRMRRARGLSASGRHAAALAWLRSASEAAARRGDDWTTAMALSEYGRLALRRPDPGRVASVRGMCRRVLSLLRSLEPRTHVVALGCQAALHAGEIEMAAALIAAGVVECRLTEVDVPPWLAGSQMDVALWMGQWDAAAEAVGQQTATTPEARGRRALLAWLRQDRDALDALARAPASTTCHVEHATDDSGWRLVADLLVAVRRGHRASAITLAAAVAEHGPAQWGRSIAVDVLRAFDAHTEAQTVLEHWPRSGRGPADVMLRARFASDASAITPPIPECLAGIRRWGERRGVMTMWGGVAALLDEVNNAHDDVSALKRGCRWVRAHTGTGRVVVLAADTGAALVAEPDGAVPGEDDVRVPVRQGGVTIGWVMAARRARDADELAGCVKTLASVCAPAVRARLDALRVAAADDPLVEDLRGLSPSMVALRAAIARVAPTTFPVLIEGESGVGKELVARAIHRLSARRDRRLAALNCAALTDELFEAELFGHTRGAFTGAVGARTGLFEDAHQGTLFLDEVGELSPRAQAKLLRTLQEGEIRRVGDNQSRSVDVRVVAATNRPLAAAVAAGGFREDLLFRLAVVRLSVPPLRERVQDIPGLAQTFWAGASRHRQTCAWLAPDAMAALCRYDWPGNVRELQNVVAGLVLAAPERGRVTARHVATVIEVQGAGGDVVGLSLEEARRQLDRRLVTSALARHAGCRTAAARDLGVTRQGLSKLMTRLAVSAEGV